MAYKAIQCPQQHHNLRQFCLDRQNNYLSESFLHKYSELSLWIPQTYVWRSVQKNVRRFNQKRNKKSILKKSFWPE